MVVSIEDSKQHIGPIFFLDYLSLEGGTNMLSQTSVNNYQSKLRNIPEM
jgi:hypothetical protein